MTPLTRAEQQVELEVDFYERIHKELSHYASKVACKVLRDCLRAAALRASAPPETTKNQSRSDQSATPESDLRGDVSGVTSEAEAIIESASVSPSCVCCYLVSKRAVDAMAEARNITAPFVTPIQTEGAPVEHWHGRDKSGELNTCSTCVYHQLSASHVCCDHPRILEGSGHTPIWHAMHIRANEFGCVFHSRRSSSAPQSTADPRVGIVSGEKCEDERAMITLAIQLYLADRYNLSALDSVLVFGAAMADSISYGLNHTHDSEKVVDELVPWLKEAVRFRLENPPPCGLNGIIDGFKRSGGKVRVS